MKESSNRNATWPFVGVVLCAAIPAFFALDAIGRSLQSDVRGDVVLRNDLTVGAVFGSLFLSASLAALVTPAWLVLRAKRTLSVGRIAGTCLSGLITIATAAFFGYGFLRTASQYAALDGETLVWRDGFRGTIHRRPLADVTRVHTYSTRRGRTTGHGVDVRFSDRTSMGAATAGGQPEQADFAKRIAALRGLTVLDEGERR